MRARACQRSRRPSYRARKDRPEPPRFLPLVGYSGALPHRSIDLPIRPCRDRRERALATLERPWHRRHQLGQEGCSGTLGSTARLTAGAVRMHQARPGGPYANVHGGPKDVLGPRVDVSAVAHRREGACCLASRSWQMAREATWINMTWPAIGCVYRI